MLRDQIKTDLRKKIEEVFDVKVNASEIHLEHPQNPKFGDYATNVALTLSPTLKQSSMEIAKELVLKILQDVENGKGFEYLEKVAAAAPGFVNLTVSREWLQSELTLILELRENYGIPEEVRRSNQKQKVQVEFVSANPTGPLHVGNARGGPLGDVLANVLEKVGYQVEREYYHNDVGGQVKKLGESVFYWYRRHFGEEPAFPEGGYEGDYVKDLAQTVVEQEGDRLLTRDPQEVSRDLADRAVNHFLHEILAVCRDLGINFDRVVKESELVSSSKTKKALDKLEKAEFLKKREGAVWFAPSDEFLEDRECVVIKSNGDYTYFANDIGYHLDKFNRGFSRVIDIWGANHSGHVPRMKAALKALGIDPQHFRAVLYQWVSLVRGGKKISMSKRRGEFTTAREVLDGVGRDVFRFLYLMRDAQTPLEFDLDLAEERSEKNPVYYVQYAHTRISSILRKDSGTGNADLSKLNHEAELALIRHLVRFPEVLEDVAESYAVHQLAFYVMKTADLFHRFYEQCPVLTAGTPMKGARLALATATGIIIKDVLGLLGVSVPERM